MRTGLANARELAATICTALAPHCHRIAICGQVRMERPTISQIDILAGPIDPASIVTRCAEKCRIITADHRGMVADMRNGLPIHVHYAKVIPEDLVRAEQGNFGIQLLLRSAEKPFVAGLVRAARDQGYVLDAMQGLLYRMRPVAIHEEEIFLTLGMEFVHPRDRMTFAPTLLFEAAPF